MRRHNETVEQVVESTTTYRRPIELKFSCPEEHEMVVAVKEHEVVRDTNDEIVSNEFTRSHHETMSAQNKDELFKLYNRQGDYLRDITYKDLFYAVESFYFHLAEKADQP